MTSMLQDLLSTGDKEAEEKQEQTSVVIYSDNNQNVDESDQNGAKPQEPMIEVHDMLAADEGAESEIRTSGQSEDILVALAALVELGQTPEQTTSSEESSPMTQITDLDNQEAVFGTDTNTAQNLQVMYYPSSTVGSEYTDLTYYTTTAGQFYQPVDANNTWTMYPQSYPDGTIQWQIDTTSSMSLSNIDTNGDYDQVMPYNNYDWSENDGKVHIKTEYVEETIYQASNGYKGGIASIETQSQSSGRKRHVKDQNATGQVLKTEAADDVQNASHEETHQQDENLFVQLAAKYMHQRFPIKLWNLASEPTFDAIKWSLDGNSLVIDEFQLEPALRHFFRSHKFSSFLRQLHLYGFRKMTRVRSHKGEQDRPRSDYISEYGTKDFVRDRFDLVKKVRRFYSNTENNGKDFLNTPPPTPVPSSYVASTPPPLMHHQLLIEHSYHSSSSMGSMYTMSPQEQNHHHHQHQYPPKPLSHSSLSSTPPASPQLVPTSTVMYHQPQPIRLTFSPSSASSTTFSSGTSTSGQLACTSNGGAESMFQMINSSSSNVDDESSRGSSIASDVTACFQLNDKHTAYQPVEYGPGTEPRAAFEPASSSLSASAGGH